MLKFSDFYLDKHKSFIPKKNMKCSMHFLQPTDGVLSRNSPSIYGTGFQFCEYYSHNFVYADSKLDLIQIDLITRPQLSGRAFSFCSAQRGPFSLNNS